MRRFARQDLQYRGGHTQMVQLLAAGEFPLWPWPRAAVSVVRATARPSIDAQSGLLESRGHGRLQGGAPSKRREALRRFHAFEEIQQIWVNAMKGSAQTTPKDPRWQGTVLPRSDLAGLPSNKGFSFSNPLAAAGNSVTGRKART